MCGCWQQPHSYITTPALSSSLDQAKITTLLRKVDEISVLGSTQNHIYVVFNKYYMMVMMVYTEAKCQPLSISLGISNRQLSLLIGHLNHLKSYNFPLNESERIYLRI